MSEYVRLNRTNLPGATASLQTKAIREMEASKGMDSTVAEAVPARNT